MRVLVTGATGYVGGELIPRLQRDGHDVVAFARDPARVPGDLEVVTGDAVTGSGLDAALHGAEVAYYLIHSMETAAGGEDALESASGGADALKTAPDGTDDFAAREREAAQRFAQAARRAGTRRVVYLGGLVPADAPPSAHLRSRLAVERVLLDAVDEGVAMRASIVIGARSRSFRFLVRLVERLPVLALPGWRDRRTQPIDGRDVIELLARAACAPEVVGRSLDIAGPEVISYGAMIERIRDLMLVGRPALRLGRLQATAVTSRIASALADEDHALIGPLMEGLSHDLLPRDDRAAALLGVRLHSLDAAVEHALRVWEEHEPLAAR